MAAPEAWCNCRWASRQEEALQAAGRLSAVKPVLDHADIRGVIYVPGRILNLVLG